MNDFQPEISEKPSPEDAFFEPLRCNVAALTRLATLFARLSHARFDKTFLNNLFMESSEAEDFLDSAGALGNAEWFPFRRAVAGVKVFSGICYKMISLSEKIRGYYLFNIEGDFRADTLSTCDTVQSLLLNACVSCLNEGLARGLISSDDKFPENDIAQSCCNVISLPATRRPRHESDPGGVAITLATEFLVLAESNEIFECGMRAVEGNIPLQELVPDPLNVGEVRLLETRFHNMQSLYDTYVLGSDLQQQDGNLSVMRGHISVIYDLLEVATDCIHYYQRHMSVTGGVDLPFDDRSLSIPVNYCLLYADRYRKATRDLCQNMLKRYAKRGTVITGIPNYRGFHVRPSTLVAKIVLHYGSEVNMKLFDTVYDASRPLELFRANEVINSAKRKDIFEAIATSDKFLEWNAKLENEPVVSVELFREATGDIFRALTARNKLIVYGGEVPSFDDINAKETDTLLEFARRAVVRFMALGRVDTLVHIQAAFEGDERVLQDLKVLAEYGYGEDRFGNNIVLPKSLGYLTR